LFNNYKVSEVRERWVGLQMLNATFTDIHLCHSGSLEIIRFVILLDISSYHCSAAWAFGCVYLFGIKKNTTPSKQLFQYLIEKSLDGSTKLPNVSLCMIELCNWYCPNHSNKPLCENYF